MDGDEFVIVEEWKVEIKLWKEARRLGQCGQTNDIAPRDWKRFKHRNKTKFKFQEKAKRTDRLGVTGVDGGQNLTS